MSAAGHEDISKQVKIYLGVFAALAVGTLITVAASWLQVGIMMGIVIALIIACVKGTLVAGYFMHLFHEQKLIYWSLALCVLFFFALLLIPVLSVADHADLPPEASPIVLTGPTTAAPSGSH